MGAEVVELGRHTILRGWRARARAGSSPAFGTSICRNPGFTAGFFFSGENLRWKSRFSPVSWRPASAPIGKYPFKISGIWLFLRHILNLRSTGLGVRHAENRQIVELEC